MEQQLERTYDAAEYVVAFFDLCLDFGKPDVSKREVERRANAQSINHDLARRQLEKEAKSVAAARIQSFLDEINENRQKPVSYRTFKTYLTRLHTWYPARADDFRSLESCLRQFEDGSVLSTDFQERLQGYAPLVDVLRDICRFKKLAQRAEDSLTSASALPDQAGITIATTELVSARFLPRVIRQHPDLMGVLPQPTIDEPYRLLRDVEKGLASHDLVITYGPPHEVKRIGDLLRPISKPGNGYTLVGRVTLHRCVIGAPQVIYDWIDENNTDVFRLGIFDDRTIAIFRDLEKIMPNREFWYQLNQRKRRLLRYKSSLEVHAYARWGGNCIALSHIELLNELGQEELGFLVDGPSTPPGHLPIGTSDLAFFVRNDKDASRNRRMQPWIESILEEFREMEHRDSLVTRLQDILRGMKNFYQIGWIAHKGNVKSREKRLRTGTLMLRVSPNLIAQGRLRIKPFEMAGHRTDTAAKQEHEETYHVSGRIQFDGCEPTVGQMSFRVFESSMRIRSTAFCLFERKFEAELKTPGLQENTLIGHWHGIDSDSSTIDQSTGNAILSIARASHDAPFKSKPSEIAGYWLLHPAENLKIEDVESLIKQYCDVNGLPML